MFEVFKVIKPGKQYTYERRILDIADKVRGAMITKETRCVDENGELESISTQNFFIKGLGGFSNKGNHDFNWPKKPIEKPEKIVTDKIESNMAFIYRLNGDWNPIHVDPDFSMMGGF